MPSEVNKFPKNETRLRNLSAGGFCFPIVTILCFSGIAIRTEENKHQLLVSYFPDLMTSKRL